ncbi:hypothetical protein AMTRI_Chr11g97090 [Amborella trichopoda]
MIKVECIILCFLTAFKAFLFWRGLQYHSAAQTHLKREANAQERKANAQADNDPIKNQTYSNVPAILYFLEKGSQPTVTVHDISKKADVCKNIEIEGTMASSLAISLENVGPL